MEMLIFLFSLITMAISDKCQQITIPMCRNIGYNFTQMPNSFNHDSQEEAGLEVHQYWPLVEIKCSPDLKFFICSLYVPICMEDYKGSVTVCRSVCERAREGCEPVMTHYGFQWPERFACSNFPPFGLNSICMDEKKGQLPSNKSITTTTTNNLHDNKKNCSCTCKKPLLKHPHRNVYNLIQNCTLPCKLYPNEGRFADVWLTFWSVCCCGISFVTMVTFALDTGRFNYPERPIVYLSICYFLISIGYLLRVYHGHDLIACEEFGTKLVVRETNFVYNYCSLVFFLVYYFGVAGACWWVTLSLSWYLAAALKWGSEAISQKWPLFHIIAWILVPMTLSLAASSSGIDGDPVGGICFLGNEENLFYFVVLPGVVLLLLGTVFLLWGFVELCRIRRAISAQLGKTEKLEKLMIRIGVFSLLYTFPASAVIATQFYEVYSTRQWILANFCCSHGNASTTQKYFLTLAVGITTGGVWIWSRKTMETWGRLCCYSNVKTKEDNKGVRV